MTRLLLIILAVTLSGCASIERLAIPKSSLIDQKLAATGLSSEPDHGVWDRFLKRYLIVDSEGVGRLSYAQVSAQDKSDLDEYVSSLSKLNATHWPRNAQLAYWSNLYNAKTVSVILDHYPVASIRKIKNGVFDLGPWEDKRLEVDGESLSLHDIEHGIVRPLWPDTPEIHYLLNCAAVGCPSLVDYAYNSKNVVTALETNARLFINTSRGVRLNDRGNLVLSKIYAWYLGDFGGKQSTVIEHLLRYANDDTRRAIQQRRGSVRYAYDWSLNDAEVVPR